MFSKLQLALPRRAPLLWSFWRHALHVFSLQPTIDDYSRPKSMSHRLFFDVTSEAVNDDELLNRLLKTWPVSARVAHVQVELFIELEEPLRLPPTPRHANRRSLPLPSSFILTTVPISSHHNPLQEMLSC